MLPREELLKGVENREQMARILDLADRAIKTWEVAVTDFLSPIELMETQTAFNRLTEVDLVAFGGYPQAERQRVAIARIDLPLDRHHCPLSGVRNCR